MQLRQLRSAKPSDPITLKELERYISGAYGDLFFSANEPASSGGRDSIGRNVLHCMSEFAKTKAGSMRSVFAQLDPEVGEQLVDTVLESDMNLRAPNEGQAKEADNILRAGGIAI